MNLPFDPDEVSRRLLAWYGKEGRDLPWRETRDPYRIWLSEIMLQQTTVAAVIPYYQRFLERFPTLDTLAKASLDDVITLWAGLGYYSRARNLHKAAQQITAESAGVFPNTFEDLTALPGIGRSTAGAILSIAFDTPAPILDGNVRRVLVRLFAWEEDPRSSRAEKQLWAWAEALTPETDPHDYAQAIMDLGATVCTPRDPDCGKCPLQEICQACRKELATTLPIARKKQKIPVRKQVALIICGSDGILLRQRPTEGFLGGLWEFPAVDLSPELEPEQAAVRLLSDLGLHGGLNKSGEIRHAYSHFKLELTVFRVEANPTGIIAERSAHRWCSGTELESLPLHGAHRKAYNKHKGDD
ncbi:MAG: A/G-specific adenine glycosylase [Deltaproteobacteria bacterium]|nr:MAG: A/G-specific adenine glycosylase [Deltaproteobacteria bacterium]